MFGGGVLGQISYNTPGLQRGLCGGVARKINSPPTKKLQGQVSKLSVSINPPDQKFFDHYFLFQPASLLAHLQSYKCGPLFWHSNKPLSILLPGFYTPFAVTLLIVQIVRAPTQYTVTDLKNTCQSCGVVVCYAPSICLSQIQMRPYRPYFVLYNRDTVYGID